MSVVHLHPEQLFDALRAGKLSAADRTRLEAHCARCSACLFELRWVDAAPLLAAPSREDRAYADAACDNVLRAKRVQPAPSRALKLKPLLGASTLFLALGAGIGLLVTPSERPQPPSRVPAVTVTAPQPREAPPVTSVSPDNQVERPVQAPSAPSANQLLAAARRAQSAGQLSRAQRLYRQVVAGYPATAAAGAAQVALGRLLFDAQQLTAALSQFDGYLLSRPSGPLAEDALFYRGLTFEKLGNVRSAAASFGELLRRFPHSLYAEPAQLRLGAAKSSP